MSTCMYCDKPAEGRGLCAGHLKRSQRGGGDLSAPLKPAATERSPWDVLVDNVHRYADAESNEEFDAAKDALRKSAKTYGRKEHHHLIKQGLWLRKAAGLPIGRPAKLTRADAEAALAKHGGQRPAARALGVSPRAIRRALKR